MRPPLLAAIALAATLVALFAGCGGGSDNGGSGGSGDAASFAEVEQIIERRCFACHSNEPTEYGYETPPAGLAFDEEGVIEKSASKINARVVVQKDMPLLNQTEMTQAERDRIGSWFEGGAKK